MPPHALLPLLRRPLERVGRGGGARRSLLERLSGAAVAGKPRDAAVSQRRLVVPNRSRAFASHGSIECVRCESLAASCRSLERVGRNAAGHRTLERVGSSPPPPLCESVVTPVVVGPDPSSYIGMPDAADAPTAAAAATVTGKKAVSRRP